MNIVKVENVRRSECCPPGEKCDKCFQPPHFIKHGPDIKGPMTVHATHALTLSETLVNLTCAFGVPPRVPLLNPYDVRDTIKYLREELNALEKINDQLL